MSQKDYLVRFNNLMIELTHQIGVKPLVMDKGTIRNVTWRTENGPCIRCRFDEGSQWSYYITFAFGIDEETIDLRHHDNDVRITQDAKMIVQMSKRD